MSTWADKIGGKPSSLPQNQTYQEKSTKKPSRVQHLPIEKELDEIVELDQQWARLRELFSDNTDEELFDAVLEAEGDIAVAANHLLNISPQETVETKEDTLNVEDGNYVVDLLRDAYPMVAYSLLESFVGYYAKNSQINDDDIFHLLSEMEALNVVAVEESMELSDVLVDSLGCNGRCGQTGLQCVVHAQQSRLAQLENKQKPVVGEHEEIKAEELGFYTTPWKNIETKRSSSSPASSASLKHAALCRQNAHVANQKKRALLKRAADEWSRRKFGSGGTAAFYREEASVVDKEMQRWNQEAYETIVAYHSKEDAPHVVDLHYLTVKEAIDHVNNRLTEFSHGNLKKLEIITGKGLHSDQQVAKIRPAIVRLLKNRGFRIEVSEGRIDVRK